MKLINNWKQILYKSYTNICAFIALIVHSIYMVVPTIDSLPESVVSLIPLEILPFVSIGFIIIGILVRVIPQPKLHPEDN